MLRGVERVDCAGLLWLSMLSWPRSRLWKVSFFSKGVCVSRLEGPIPNWCFKVQQQFFTFCLGALLISSSGESFLTFRTCCRVAYSFFVFCVEGCHGIETVPPRRTNAVLSHAEDKARGAILFDPRILHADLLANSPRVLRCCWTRRSRGCSMSLAERFGCPGTPLATNESHPFRLSDSGTLTGRAAVVFVLGQRRA